MILASIHYPTALSPGEITFNTHGIFLVTLLLISPFTTTVGDEIFSPKYLDTAAGNLPLSI